MQIVSVHISNLLSFPYQEQQDLMIGTYFDIHQNWGVNVLIWPNGSGKTNFLEIITQILKTGLIQDYIYNNQATDIHQYIVHNPQYLENIKKHFAYQDKPSLVDIELHMTANDKENMLFLQKQKIILNTILERYTALPYRILECWTEAIQRLQTLHIQFSVDTENKTATIINKQKTNEEQFAVEYLNYQELFQIAINIFNETFKKDDEKAFYPLKNTFWYLWSTRNFNSIQDGEITPKLWESYINKKNKSEYGLLIGYALCIKKIRNIIYHRSEENIEEKQKKEVITSETIEKKLENSLFYKSLKENIKKYIDKEIKIKYKDKEIWLFFVDNMWQQHDIHDLSDGEQSFLIIILTIYGYDFKDGIIIIDEPEIHFHPQVQRRLINMLEKLNKNIWTQCIISTYSPIFINEDNIKNVYRFSKKWGNTLIKKPDSGLEEDESSLVQILKFENAAKIFFVDKIIMVEGEIDAYFFEYYLQYLHTLPERKEKVTNYEVVNINGKWWYKKRNKFLKKFGIESYFVGDWDNIVDYGFISQIDLNFYYKQSKIYNNSLKKGKNTIGNERHYTKLVNTVKYLYPDKYKSILEHIENLYKNNVFILQKGDIETYLGMKSKWLEETIEFCHHYFHMWLKNKELKDHRKEFEEIFYRIFS